MKNNNWNNIKYKSLIDYVDMIRSEFVAVAIIFLAVTSIALAYSIFTKDKYTASTVLKIAQPEGNILDASSFLPDMADRGADRFIANEIETMHNITIRKQVAQVMIDSFKNLHNTDNISLFLKSKNMFADENDSIKSAKEISAALINYVKIEQKKGLDFIEITAESPSPYEAALIVNTYAKVYRQFNLLDNRKQVTRVKEFLEEEKNKKYNDLVVSENDYKLYQLRGGVVQLDEQARTLIETMTELESRVNENSIELAITKESLERYKNELKKKDLSLSRHLETKASEPYLISLQNQIAELETQRDMAVMSNKRVSKNQNIVNQYDEKIFALKQKLKESMDSYQASVLSASPQEIKELTERIFEQEVKYNSLLASDKQMKNHIANYERRFDRLPERSIDLARLERNRKGNEKIYLLLEEKYQEALVNEQSIEGNILILNLAELPDTPSSPNRKQIILIGLVIGLVMGMGYAIARDSLDNSVRSPDDIEELDINLLGWIPQISEFENNGMPPEFVVANTSDSLLSDSYKSLRTMVRKRNKTDSSKSILISSSAQSEGKTLTSLNLAGSFAQAGYKTVLIDCDLRKPRIHTVLEKKRVPGFSDYFIGKSKFEDIIQNAYLQNMKFIGAGSIPNNPTEILDSDGMVSFLKILKTKFDIIIIDSPPLFGLADALILSEIVDETMLVAKADQTDINLLEKSVSLIKNNENANFIGVILNGFNLRKNYGSYYYRYSYSYSYSHNGSKKKTNKSFKQQP